MATLAFVLFFVVLGLGALALAMTGGQRRASTATRSGRKSGIVLFAIALFALGIAVPVAVIAADRGRNSIPEADVGELTPLQERGRDLFGQRCRNCHALKAASATANVGPNLDELAPGKALVLDAIQKGRARGNGQMPADIFEGEDAEAVAEFVAVAVGGSLEEGGEESGGGG